MTVATWRIATTAAPANVVTYPCVMAARAIVRAVNLISATGAPAPARNVISHSAVAVCKVAKPVIAKLVAIASKTNSAPVASKPKWKTTMPNPKTHPLTRRHLRRPRQKRQRKPTRPTLRFSPYAWAKLLYLRDAGPTEVGGFGTTQPDDLLFVNDLVLIEQHCTEVTVAFEDHAVADFFEDQIDCGYRPEQFGRIWIHTHPGDSPQPSSVDVETFDRVFGNCDWAVMFIIAKGGKTYAELYWRHGGPAALRMHVDVDYSHPFASSDQQAWDAEYRNCVHIQHQIIQQDINEWEEWLSDNKDAPELQADLTPHFGPQEPESFMNSDITENA